MDINKIGRIYTLNREIEAALRSSSPLEKQKIPAGSKIKILSSSGEYFYEFVVVDCVLRSIKKKQVYVIARNDLDGWITE